MENRYFDNGATSFPKSEAVIQAVEEALRHGGSYGRSAYRRVVENTRMVERTRRLFSSLIGSRDSGLVAFGTNATWGANSILQRLDFCKGDIVYHSAMEHNSVMRPLSYISKTKGVELRVLPSMSDGRVDLEAIESLDFSDVRLVVVNHASNVNGVVQPLREISQRLPQGVEFMVDGAQSLGVVEVDVESMGIDYLVFTGHKSLGGITGSGGFYSRYALLPFTFGGTGSRSESYEMPDDEPDRYEAGTPNVVGILALGAALRNRIEREHTKEDFREFVSKIAGLQGVRLYYSESGDGVELFSFTHSEFTPSEIADRLSQRFDIEVRPGLHCAPLAHRTLGTMPQGTVRVSLSPYHTPRDLEFFYTSLVEVLK